MNSPVTGERRSGVCVGEPMRVYGSCADCRHRDADAKSLEHTMAGLSVFSFCLGPGVADSRRRWPDN
jgi:hypothetical protein